MISQQTTINSNKLSYHNAIRMEHSELEVGPDAQDLPCVDITLRSTLTLSSCVIVVNVRLLDSLLSQVPFSTCIHLHTPAYTSNPWGERVVGEAEQETLAGNRLSEFVFVRAGTAS